MAHHARRLGRVLIPLEAFFFAAVLLTVYPYLVYPLVLPMVAWLFGRPSSRSSWAPLVSLIIPVYNELEVIGLKLDNSLSLDYPRDRLEILVGSDGSSDGSLQIVQGYADRGVRLFGFAERRGKPSVLNDLVAASRGEILVLTDASALLDPRAIREIVASFGSDDVGVVSGEMVPVHGEGAVSALDLYRRIDNRLRRLESRLHSSTGAAGALYGIRRSLFVPLPGDTILDDFVTPLRVVERGYRVLICPEARFTELERTTLKNEFRRKVRTLAGNYQALGRLWRLLVPGWSPVWFPLLSHKVLRLLTPYFMLALLPLNLFLLDRPAFRLVLVAQVVFYLSSGLGFLLRHRRRRISFLHYPFLVVLMQAANLFSLLKYLSGGVTMRWEKQNRIE